MAQAFGEKSAQHDTHCIYLVDSLLTLYLYVLILRFVMQLTRADFRNQIAHAVLVVTNPLIMPLRRILPPMGKIDTRHRCWPSCSSRAGDRCAVPLIAGNGSVARSAHLAALHCCSR